MGFFMKRNYNKSKNDGIYILYRKNIKKTNRNKILYKNGEIILSDFNSWVDKDDIIKYTHDIFYTCN